MGINLLQAALALLLAVQNNPAVTDATRAEVLALSNQVVQYVNKPQVLGVVVSPKDNTLWHASSESLNVVWAEVLTGDQKWWNPPYVRFDLEGKFDGVHPEERPLSEDIAWDGGGYHSYTIPARSIAPGSYRLFVIGTKTPGSGLGAWAMTPPVNIVVQ